MKTKRSMKERALIDIRDPQTRLTKRRRAEWIDAAMTQASAIEGTRRTRLLERRDVERLVDAIRAYARKRGALGGTVAGAEIRTARSYAQNGRAFVPKSYRYYAPITACVVGAGGQPEVAVFDAKRQFGRAASVTVNGRAVLIPLYCGHMV